MPDFSLSLFAFVAMCFAAAMTGAFFGPGKWYERLEKPPWTPPNWAFPVVWMILYGMIAVSGWILWTAPPGTEIALPLGLWGLQLALNAAWSPVFFGLRRLDLGMVVVSGMWVSILATIVACWPVSWLAALLLVPYLVWVTIAAALNLSVWRRNPDAHNLAV